MAVAISSLWTVALQSCLKAALGVGSWELAETHSTCLAALIFTLAEPSSSEQSQSSERDWRQNCLASVSQCRPKKENGRSESEVRFKPSAQGQSQLARIKLGQGKASNFQHPETGLDSAQFQLALWRLSCSSVVLAVEGCNLTVWFAQHMEALFPSKDSTPDLFPNKSLSGRSRFGNRDCDDHGLDQWHKHNSDRCSMKMKP